MNALYIHAQKQKTQLQQDIAKFEQDNLTAPISLQGSISATLVAFEKTIEQYKQHFDKRRAGGSNDEEQLDPKYELRLVSLKKDHKDFDAKFKELKQKYNENNARSKLFESPLDAQTGGESVMNQRRTATNDNTSQPGNTSSNYGLPMYDGLQKEQSIFQRGNAQLDMILEMGQQSLDDIMEQNQILLKVQDQMSRSLRTLGVSEETIQTINKRVFKDKLIFILIIFLFLVGVYYVLKWFR